MLCIACAIYIDHDMRPCSNYPRVAVECKEFVKVKEERISGTKGIMNGTNFIEAIEPKLYFQ